LLRAMEGWLYCGFVMLLSSNIGIYCFSLFLFILDASSTSKMRRVKYLLLGRMYLDARATAVPPRAPRKMGSFHR
jgi:hypothetical protein